MSNPHNLKVGQEVFLNNKEIRSGKILTVGNKFFTIDISSVKFFNDTLVKNNNYGLRERLYLSKQEIEELKESETIKSKLLSEYNYFSNFTLDQLKRINNIFDERKVN